jgi:hypothetical protein
VTWIQESNTRTSIDATQLVIIIVNRTLDSFIQKFQFGVDRSGHGSFAHHAPPPQLTMSINYGVLDVTEILCGLYLVLLKISLISVSVFTDVQVLIISCTAPKIHPLSPIISPSLQGALGVLGGKPHPPPPPTG